jgi:DNA-directed RNA polymerase subunit RPC12/RpoP
MSTATRTVFCRYCKGLRVVIRGLCCGCGSDVSPHAQTTAPERKQCPKCTSGVLRQPRGSYNLNCDTCGYASGMMVEKINLMKGGRHK